MPEAAPAEAAGGQTPADGEGKTPAEGEVTPTEGKPEEGTTYPESYVKQLRREAAANRNKVSELEERLNEIEDRDKSEAEKKSEKLTAAERRAEEAETRLLRVEIARERGLDLDAAAFLTGSTREEIEHRAEELGKLLADKGGKPSTGFDGGARQIVPETKKPEEAHNDLLLRSLGMEPRR